MLGATTAEMLRIIFRKERATERPLLGLQTLAEIWLNSVLCMCRAESKQLIQG